MGDEGDGMIRLPTWEEAEKAVKAGLADPIHEFVYHQEPSGEQAERDFRLQLNTLIGFVYAIATNNVEETFNGTN